MHQGNQLYSPTLTPQDGSDTIQKWLVITKYKSI